MSLYTSTPTPLSVAVHNLLDIREAHRRHAVSLLHNGQSYYSPKIDIGGCSIVCHGKLKVSKQGKTTDVVIKFIRTQLSDTALKPCIAITRLLREIVVWRYLRHRNIAEFIGLDFSESNLIVPEGAPAPALYAHQPELRVPGLVSPYLEHGILSFVFKYPHQSEACITDIARGLTYLHKKYVIHGDLRPDNVRVDYNGIVKIIDFGFSKLVNVTGFTTAAYNNVGPRFAAPELIDIVGDHTKRPTFKSDVYAFSMCMLQILAHPELPDSSLPYNHITAPESIIYPYFKEICLAHGRPRREMYLARSITDDLWNLMARCWHSNQNARPRIHEVLEILSGRSCTDTPGGMCWL